jgi:transposase-like protein
MKGSKFNVIFKQEAIRMINDEGQSVTDISQKIGIISKPCIVGLMNISGMTFSA